MAKWFLDSHEMQHSLIAPRKKKAPPGALAGGAPNNFTWQKTN
jgi:hypothetical protein